MKTRLILIVLLQITYLAYSKPELAFGRAFVSINQQGPLHLCGLNLYLFSGFPTPSTGIPLTVGGDWLNSCKPRFHALTLEDMAVRVNMLRTDGPDTVCEPTFTPWEFTTHLPHLPAGGEYRAELYIAGGPDSAPPTLCASALFTVTEQPYAMYLPLVVNTDMDPR